MKAALCHPDRKCAARGMCSTCYGYWRYHNVPEYRQARIASASRRQAKRKRKPRPYVPCPDIEIPPLKEGFATGTFYFTAGEKAALKACLR